MTATERAALLGRLDGAGWVSLAERCGDAGVLERARALAAVPPDDLEPL